MHSEIGILCIITKRFITRSRRPELFISAATTVSDFAAFALESTATSYAVCVVTKYLFSFNNDFLYHKTYRVGCW